MDEWTRKQQKKYQLLKDKNKLLQVEESKKETIRDILNDLNDIKNSQKNDKKLSTKRQEGLLKELNKKLRALKIVKSRLERIQIEIRNKQNAIDNIDRDIRIKKLIPNELVK